MHNEKSSLNRKNILVTGGAGFIGSHLCEELVKDNNVICLDDFSSSNVENIRNLLQNPNFEFIKHDISKPTDLEEMHELDKFKIKFKGLQEVYHLACPTSPKNFNKLRIQTLKSNSQGVINALEIAKKYNSKFLLTSSVVIYGPRYKDAPLFTEDYLGYVNSVGERSCYDEGKRFAEAATVTYQQSYSVDVKIARIFRTYGPRLALFDGQMVSDFILQALNNKPLVIFGKDDFSTSLCYVVDIVEALVKFMASSESGPMNFGHYEEYKMSDIAAKVIQMTNSQSKIEYHEPLVFMSPLGLPDISLAKKKLGWYPLISLDEGLKNTIEYIRANQNILQPMLWKYDNN